MSKGSQNKFLPVYFAILGVGGIGLAYMGWSAGSDRVEAQLAFESSRTKLNALQNAPLSRNDANVAEKKKRVDAYVAKVAALNSTLLKYQPPVDTADNTALQKKLQKYSADITSNAKGKNVAIPAKFDFGMDKYASGDFQSLPDGAAGPLSAQLETLNFIANAAIEAGVTSIDAMAREEIAVEKAAEPATAPSGRGNNANNRTTPRSSSTAGASSRPGNKQTATKAPAGPAIEESKVFERQPVRISVTGKHQSVTALLEALANTSPDKNSPHFITIRTLKIENEVKKGVEKSKQVASKEVKPEDGSAPYVVDAEFVLGNQAVKAYFDLDILRFIEPEAPKDAASKGSSDKGTQPAAPKVDASKPAASAPGAGDTAK